MKPFVLTCVLLLAGCASGAGLMSSPARAADDTHTVVLDGHRFEVEVATTNQTRARGLMDRTELAADRGMLFVFARQMPQVFWMKNTLVALDILYFDKDRKLVSMQLDAPPCKADPCPTFPSYAPALYVLELPAGTAARIGAAKGDRMEIEGRIGHVEP